ncbi:MAG: hypothetical protein A2Z99_09630 [Treponema sp. GWB1_62_6]|nr:MAG: hypothetical protein A2Y36_08645 [Treponema sp. GWA1_62_8]OHE64818.1 MAG: hypothetical protein A2001_04710 [Treponema sp. GWC1_61_84]OHE68417.1 MAG: hypothetical protein A2Z99_09630 [Treponema sp. GWB1_62_6]HCM27663.1 hypothetical protein [Treponema sp.]
MHNAERTERRKIASREPFAAVALLSAAVLFSCAGKAAVPAVAIDGYRTWDRTTLAPLNFPIPGHESHYRRIFMNPVGSAYRASHGSRDAPFDYPDGTVVVKEIFDGLDVPASDEAPVAFTLMVKNRASHDARGGWLWIVRDAASGKDTVFTGDFCVNCHGGANESHPYGDKNAKSTFRDYMFY